MGYLENFKTGIEFARAMLDKISPEWQTASVNIEFDANEIQYIMFVAKRQKEVEEINIGVAKSLNDVLERIR